MDKRLFFLSLLLIEDMIFASLMTSRRQCLSIYLFHNISLSISIYIYCSPLQLGTLPFHWVPVQATVSLPSISASWLQRYLEWSWSQDQRQAGTTLVIGSMLGFSNFDIDVF